MIIIAENKFCSKQKLIILTPLGHQCHLYKHNFYEFWSLNTIARSKMLNVSYKQTTQWSRDFSVATIELPTTPSLFI